jgi:DNA-binding NarL/FixJ family response regulator
MGGILYISYLKGILCKNDVNEKLMLYPDGGRLRLLIVDDHPLFRQGLRMLLMALNRDLVVDEAGDLSQALGKSDACDMIFLDLKMPGIHGLEALEVFKTRFPERAVVVVSGDHSPALVRETIARGAMGLIPKSLSPEQLVESLERVLDHKVYIPLDVLPEDEDGVDDVFADLTSRQMDVLRYVVQGKSNKVVARDLGVSAETVKSHLTAVMRSLGASNRTELVYIAARRGLRLV